MPKLITTQPPLNILVANLTSSSDPSLGSAGNPSKARVGFTLQHRPENPRHRAGQAPVNPGDVHTPGTSVGGSGNVSGTLTASSGAVTVADNDFTVPTTLYLGPYTITSGEDFTVGGGVNDTATALASAIDALPGFSASAAIAVVTVTGPVGLNGNEVRFTVRHKSSITNYTLNPANGLLSGGLPAVDAPSILT